jgi:hypothetical protein
MKRLKADPGDRLHKTLLQIKHITEYLNSSKEKATVRSLSAAEKAKFAETIERALLLIIGQLASVNIEEDEVTRDSFCTALQLLPSMLPQDLACVLCKLFDQLNVEKWFSMLMAQVPHAHTLLVQEALVQALVTLASFVQQTSLASLRQGVFRDLLGLLGQAGEAMKVLHISEFRPFHSEYFNGIAASTVLELHALHECCLSLAGYLSVSIGPFVSDCLGSIWSAACCALSYGGRPALLSQAVGCMTQLCARSPMPATCQDSFLWGLIRVLQPAYGARSKVTDDLLARLLLDVVGIINFVCVCVCMYEGGRMR